MRLSVAIVLVMAVLCASCMHERQARDVGEIEALRGKTSRDVLALLGTPRVIDSTASPTERIWGYYQVPLRSDHQGSPRQRTVLIVFVKEDSLFIVRDVRIP